MSKYKGERIGSRRFRLKDDDWWGYAFIFVAMLVFCIFTLYPVLSAVKTSFLKYKPFGSEFIGLKNYQDTFKSELFFKAVKNTVLYTAVVVPLSLLIAFSIAIMILPFRKGVQSVFKSIYYLPGIASGVALSVVWLWLYDSSPDGLFNQVMTFFGLPTQNWLSSSKTSMLSLMLMAILSGQGTNIIIYIAALMGIDNSYFEAAELDGATFFQKVRYIVFPLVKPTTLFLLVTGVIGWVLGTALGALAGGLLPKSVTDALGIAIYGMFIAIVLPPFRKSRQVRFVVLIAVAMSCMFEFLSFFSFISGGFRIILRFNLG